MKKRTGICLLLSLCILFLSGCRVTDTSSDETKPLDYTVMKEEEIPKELKSLIEEKKAEEFQMTYQSGDSLYLVKGYGQQMSGGYSIQIQEVSLGEAAVYFKTSLIGPAKEEKVSQEPSYPYLVVRLAYREEPVQFQ